MTATEFYRTQERLYERRDIPGMLNLMAEYDGQLEGELTEEQLMGLDVMGSWALRLADAELLQNMQDRLLARYLERQAREGGTRKLLTLDPDPEPAKKPRLRWW
jgi:hypothetical protein